jgi:hypothetical protein
MTLKPGEAKIRSLPGAYSGLRFNGVGRLSPRSIGHPVSRSMCSRPKLVNGGANRCSFIFDGKYDELRWFRLTCVTR